MEASTSCPDAQLVKPQRLKRKEIGLEIAFKTRDLRALCEELGESAQLPRDVTEALKRRLADVRAAHSVGDLVAGSPSFRGDRGERLQIGLADAHTLILKANHADNPVDEDGRVDWSNVSRVKVMAVESRDG
jgi:hypothetical protein